ncbi:MAG: HTH domain-containing protein [bacterium]
MINLNELRADDLKKIMVLRQKIELLETEMAAILKKAQKREPPLSVTIRNMRLPRKAQPSLRDLVSTILTEAGKPMSVHDIYEASLSGGYQWRSQEPINALNVKMYTDRTFKKASPGLFVLRNPEKAKI